MVNFSAVRSSDRGQPSRSRPVVTTRSPSIRLPGVAPPGLASQPANHRVTGRVSTAMPASWATTRAAGVVISVGGTPTARPTTPRRASNPR
jgi:hypothetical protein